MAISDKPQPNPMTAPRYAEIPTFMRTPYSRDLNGVDTAFRVRKRAIGERRLDQQCRRETAVGVGILVDRFGRRRVKQQGFVSFRS